MPEKTGDAWSVAGSVLGGQQNYFFLDIVIVPRFEEEAV